MSGRRPYDLSDFSRDERYTIEIRASETPEERSARIERERDDARHRRQVFWSIFVLLIASAVVTLLIVVLAENAENRSWARAVFSAIVAGLVGYIGGRAARSTD